MRDPTAAIDKVPIPPSLVHPRWFIEPPEYRRRWVIAYEPNHSSKSEDDGEDKGPEPVVSGGVDKDRYRDGGRKLILKTGTDAVVVGARLETSEARERFAKLLNSNYRRVAEECWTQQDRREALPGQLPRNLKRSELFEFKEHGNTKRRGLTGAELTGKENKKIDKANAEAGKEPVDFEAHGAVIRARMDARRNGKKQPRRIDSDSETGSKAASLGKLEDAATLNGDN